MFEFLYLVLFRWLSGAQNGLGYGHFSKARIAATILMAAILCGTGILFATGNPFTWKILLADIFIAVSIAGAIGVEGSFNGKINLFHNDIHFFEVLATGGITLAWAVAGGNIIAIAAATYPGLIIHKGLINIFSGLPFWHHGTDDATGRTFSIPLLGIKVPRLSQRGRIILAMVSVVAGIVASKWANGITLYSILHLVGVNL